MVEKKTSKRQNTSKIMTNLKSTFYVDKEMQDITKKYYQIKRNLILQHKCIRSRPSSVQKSI